MSEKNKNKNGKKYNRLELQFNNYIIYSRFKYIKMNFYIKKSLSIKSKFILTLSNFILLKNIFQIHSKWFRNQNKKNTKIYGKSFKIKFQSRTHLNICKKEKSFFRNLTLIKMDCSAWRKSIEAVQMFWIFLTSWI